MPKSNKIYNSQMIMAAKRLYLFFILPVVLFLCLCGCFSKNKATYVSLEERRQAQQQAVGNDDIANNLKLHFTHWQGTRYRLGGLSKKGIDCSGFTLLTYKELFGVKLPRTVREQVKRGEKVSRDSLQVGDLVFFKTGIFQRHVGIYVENDQFIHASRSRGVMISNLNNSYWRKKYWRAKRL